MLILKRATNQKLYVGKNKEVVITVCELNHRYVSLGIDAPKDLPIVRDNAKNKLYSKKCEKLACFDES